MVTHTIVKGSTKYRFADFIKIAYTRLIILFGWCACQCFCHPAKLTWEKNRVVSTPKSLSCVAMWAEAEPQRGDQYESRLHYIDVRMTDSADPM